MESERTCDLLAMRYSDGSMRTITCCLTLENPAFRPKYLLQVLSGDRDVFVDRMNRLLDMGDRKTGIGWVNVDMSAGAPACVFEHGPTEMFATVRKLPNIKCVYMFDCGNMDGGHPGMGDREWFLNVNAAGETDGEIWHHMTNGTLKKIEALVIRAYQK